MEVDSNLSSNKSLQEDMRVDFKNPKECHGKEEFNLLYTGLTGRVETMFGNQSDTNYSSLEDTTAGRKFQRWNVPSQGRVSYD